eukprot:872643-Alexandrium_andersonii.AAC.1
MRECAESSVAEKVVHMSEQAEQWDQLLPLEREGDNDGDSRPSGIRTEGASGPAAREASGPLAPGAHPGEGRLAW